MKFIDHNEIPVYGNPNLFGLLYFNEIFIDITEDIVPNIVDCYKISNYGKVYNKYKGILLKQYMRGGNNSDYCYTILKLKNGKYRQIAIHRLVISSFYPQLGSLDNKLDVNHKDGIKTNNYISYNDPNRGNLEWSSRKDNIIHSYRTGLHNIGEDNCKSIITNHDAMKIIELLSLDKYTSKEIVEIVGGNCTTSIVDSIRSKESWKHLSENYNFEQRKYRLLSNDDVERLCIFFESTNPNNFNTIKEYYIEGLKTCNLDINDKMLDSVRKIFHKKYYTTITNKYNF